MQKIDKIVEVFEQRVKRILCDHDARNKIQHELTIVFTNLGIDQNKSKALCEQIFTQYLLAKSLATAEQNAYELVRKTELIVDNKNISIFDLLDRKKSSNREKTLVQYAKHLQGEKGRVIDYGAGDGILTQMFHDKLNLNIEGVDIRAVKGAGVSVPILQFNGDHVPVADKYYTAGVLNLVLHHEAHNEKILIELDRIVSNKLIVKENIPVGATEKEMLQDMDRTFMLDYLMARVIHNYKVPVPGTFETPDGWKSRFAKYGWKTHYEEDLGFDTPYLPLRKYLLVFTR